MHPNMRSSRPWWWQTTNVSKGVFQDHNTTQGFVPTSKYPDLIRSDTSEQRLQLLFNNTLTQRKGRRQPQTLNVTMFLPSDWSEQLLATGSVWLFVELELLFVHSGDTSSQNSTDSAEKQQQWPHLDPGLINVNDAEVILNIAPLHRDIMWNDIDIHHHSSIRWL